MASPGELGHWLYMVSVRRHVVQHAADDQVARRAVREPLVRTPEPPDRSPTAMRAREDTLEAWTASQRAKSATNACQPVG